VIGKGASLSRNRTKVSVPFVEFEEEEQEIRSVTFAARRERINGG